MRQSITLGKMAVAAALAAISGCGPAAKEWKPDEKRPQVFSVAYRQAAPAPVYNRLRWVHLPDVLPSRDLPAADAPQIDPVFHMQLKNVTLADAAKALAATSRYDSYCASSVAGRRVTVDELGTTSELGARIAAQSGAHVVVDRENRQVRVLERAPQAVSGVAPRFSDREGLSESTILSAENR